MNPNSYNRLLLIVSGLGGLLYGIDVGIIAGALPYLEASSGLDAAQLSFVVAAVLLGSVLSTLFAGILADWLGRRRLMLLSGVLFVLSIPLIALADGYGPLMAGRILQGLSAGLIGVVVPLYLAECLEPAQRGRGTGVFQWMLTFGIVLAALIGIYFSMRVDAVAKLGDAKALLAFKDHAWRSIFWASLPPGLLFCVGSLFVSESPRWLHRQARKVEARAALLRSRTPARASEEFEEMEALEAKASGQTSAAGKALGESLFQRRYVLPFVLACIVLVCNQTTGVNSIIGYNTAILSQSGLSDVAAHWGYLILTCVNFLVTMAGVALVDRIGRKVLLSIGSAGIVLSLLGVGWLFHQAEREQLDVADQFRLLQSANDRFEQTLTTDQLSFLLPTKPGLNDLSPEPDRSLVVLYSYGDFHGTSKVLRYSDASTHQLSLTRDACLPSNRVLAFFSNPFADLDAARKASLHIDHVLVTPVPSAAHGWMTAVLVFSFMAFFAIGPGVCVWLALSELMPTRIRSNGMSIALLLNQAASTGIAASFLPLVGRFGYATLFFAFAGCTLVYFLTAFIFLPETKGRSLEEIEALFTKAKTSAASTTKAGKSVLPLLLLGILLALGSKLEATPRGPADEVNVFIGTGGHGHTFPGATLPFGMVQLSPDTRTLGWDACGGYHYDDRFIYGFSHTHLSGVGIPDYCDVLLSPQSGAATVETPHPEQGHLGYGSRFDHAREQAHPGYYSVDLLDQHLSVELTSTLRVGLHRYTFEQAKGKAVSIDLEHRDLVLDAELRQTGPSELTGYRRSAAWAKNQVIFFVIRFNAPIEKLELYNTGHLAAPGVVALHGEHIKALVRFPDAFTSPILAKVALSPVDEAGALNNLQTELPDWDFEACRERAAARWNEVLTRFDVEGGSSAQRHSFYTALYHSYLCPNRFDDADGRYLGRDGQLHQGSHPYYTIFSLWDTYRAWHPLMTIIEPEASRDFVRTFLLMYQQGGLLPVWDLAGNETFCMNGYHSVSVIADAWAKGIRDFDTQLALKAMQGAANQTHFGLGAFNDHGFIAREDGRECVARSLEYAYDDWCISTFARNLGEKTVAQDYLQRSLNYRNLFNRDNGFLVARENGDWYSPFRPREINFNYTEGNAWHYRFAVQHDLPGLISLMGGPTAARQALDGLFNEDSRTEGRDQADVAGLIGQYAHGNEPSHHVAYLYNFVGAPSETQRRIRQIMDSQYSDAPDGLSGNEDCGQMSAWLVFSAMGFYPVTPGSTEYVIGTPLFPSLRLQLPNGRSFQVLTRNFAPNHPYIVSATLNGQPLTRSWLSHEELLGGGTLELTLSDSPKQTWATAPADWPGHALDASGFVEAPLISVPLSFPATAQLTLRGAEAGDQLWYTLDGSLPTPQTAHPYSKPLTLSSSAIIRAIAVRQGRSSLVARAEAHRSDTGLHISVQSQVNPQYLASGPNALVDGILGGPDFTTGRWQGYEGQPLDAVIDLGKVTEFSGLSIGFLQDANSYIFYPPRIVVSVSEDGQHYSPLDTLTPPADPRDTTRSFVSRPETHRGARARYVKIHADYAGDTLAWGSADTYIKSFLFCDEIQIFHE